MSEKKKRYKDYKVEHYEKDGKVKTRIMYTGDYYLLKSSEDSIRKMRIELCIYAIILNSFLFGSLFIDTLSGHKAYVVVPQVLSFGMGLLALYFLRYLFFGVRKFNARQAREIIISAKGYLVSKSILISVTTIARIVVMLVEINSYLVVKEILLLAGVFISFLFSLREVFLVKKINIEKEEQLIEDEGDESSCRE